MKKKKKEEKKQRRKLSTDSWYRFIIFFLSFVLLAALISYDPSESEWKLGVEMGEPAPRDVYAPFEFDFVDTQKTKEARKRAQDEVLDIYRINTKANQQVLKNVDTFFAEIEALQPNENGDYVLSGKIADILSEQNVEIIKELTDEEWAAFKNNVRTTIVTSQDNGLLSFSRKVDLIEQARREIKLVREGSESIVSVFDITSLSEARDNIYKEAISDFARERKLRTVFTDIVTAFLEPNVVFDAEATKAQKLKAFEATPPVEEHVLKNEIILSRGSIITASEMARIRAIETMITKKKTATGMIGVAILVFFFIIVLASYLRYFEPKLYFSVKEVLLINTIVCFNVLINKALLTFLDGISPFWMPTTFAALLVAALVKPRVAFVITLGMGVLSGVMTDYNALIIITTLFASVVGIYKMLDVRRRSQFFVVGALVGIVNFLLILSFAIVQEMSIFDSLNVALVGLGNGGVLTIMLLFFTFVFEKLFDKTTAVSLLEFSDLNHPLLKRLIIEAPGTYHHSLVVSTLAESAAEAIGANALLARVGAYFHDIGKIEKGEYFTENQTSKERNFHDNLSPRMSYFIIMNHVKDGVTLAKQYKLKKCIMDFIVQHHGTSVVYFFYKKALDEKSDDDNINIMDFRYPGPKPQSKEVAITLLADSVEAASRALSEPTPSSLRGLVDKMVNDKFLDGQLDECELTLLDLHKIKDSFVRNLMAIFHTRVEYPEMINENIQGKKISN